MIMFRGEMNDIARNLKPAYELGMKTVWIKNDEPWAAKYSDSDFINYLCLVRPRRVELPQD